jgi:hypothetical protein
MSSPQMIAHLSDQMRHALGDATAAAQPGLLRNPLVRYVVIYWLPWPLVVECYIAKVFLQHHRLPSNE